MKSKSDQSFSTLLHAARQGDRKAFGGLVRMYTEPVESFIHFQTGRRLRERVEIADLVQETFLRTFQSIGKFRGEGADKFWAWLSTIAEHVILDQVRKLQAGKPAGKGEISLEQRFPRQEGDSWSLEEALQARGTSPSRALRQDERFDRLKMVLGSLSPDHSRVIFLARIQGLPIKEVARMMDRTPEATSMLLYRALLKLRAAFGNTESFHLPDRSLEQEGGKDGE